MGELCESKILPSMTWVRVVHVLIMIFLLSIPFSSPSFEYSIRGGNEKIHHNLYFVLIGVAAIGLFYHGSKLVDCIIN